MFEEYPDVVTVNEVMKMLKVGRNTAWKLIHSGQIKTFNIGKLIKIPKKSIIEYINRQTESD